MDAKDPMNQDHMEKNETTPLDSLSGDELLSRIDEETAEDPADGEKKNDEGLLHKLGLSKKEKLKKENEELKEKAGELNDKYLRLYAEFDNFKKRSLKERLELMKTAGADVMISLLPVLDDFTRALKQMEAAADPLTEGVKLIHQKMLTVLENKGLKAMKSVGEEFNPELHDAITEVAAPDENLKGKVVDEIECGFYLNEKIIRHAKVIVGK
jgi:molecular chaperone GrpE